MVSQFKSVTFGEILRMTNDQIEKFLEPSAITQKSVKIDFKTRQSMVGLFIKTADYGELKSKNFWRIVTGGTNITQYKSTPDNNLAKIFNGAEITRLTLV